MELATSPEVTLGTLIAWIESKNNPQAMRFEPRVHDQIHTRLFTDPTIAAIRNVHSCTYETACVIYSSSFGKYQIMGENLYAPHGIASKTTIFSYCAGTAISQLAQDTDFLSFTSARGIGFPVRGLLDIGNRNRFAVIYNGSTSYSQNILDALHHFGIMV